MRTTVVKLLGRIAEVPTLPGPIVEFGALRVAGQEHLPSVASFFPGATFVGCDIRPGLHVDQVHDLHSLGLATGSVGTALLLDVVEHVREPWVALAEIHRCLKPGGIVVMSSHFFFPIHAYPDDYWRFTAAGFAVLLGRFHVIANIMSGHRRLPHTVCAVASKGTPDPGLEDPLRAAVETWNERESNSWKEHALTVLPPVAVVPLYESFRRLTLLRNRNR